MRFLRLGLPVFFAGLIIFLISKTVGFHALNTKEIFECVFVLHEQLQEHCAEVSEAIINRLDVLIPQLAESAGKSRRIYLRRLSS